MIHLQSPLRWILGIALALISTAMLFGQAGVGIKGVVAAKAQPELVQEKFMFTEGPVGTADGGLYFSDIMGADKTYRLDPGGKITLYRSGTNNMNGMALMRDGTLIGAESKRIGKVAAGGSVSTQGKPVHIDRKSTRLNSSH